MMIVATPDHWHCACTMACLAGGKNVYCEKPATHNIREARKMLETAIKYKKKLGIGTHQRSAPHMQEAREFVRSGKLGKITMTNTFTYGNESPIGIPPKNDPMPAGVDYNMWLGPAPEREFQPNRFGVYPNAYSYFRFFWDYAGGILTDSGSRMIDIVHMAMGDAMPGGVAAFGGKLWLRDDSETPDTMMVAYEYPGFLCSWEHRTNNMENANRVMAVTFHGEKGTLYVDRALFKLTPEKDSGLKAMEVSAA
jgi:predicted dehydrogenase